MTRNDYGFGYGFGRSNGRGMGGRGNGQCRRNGSGFGPGFGSGGGQGRRRYRFEENDGQPGFNVRNRIGSHPFAAAIARIEAAIEDLKRQIGELRQKA
ncbi:MAG: hypothetical protein KAX66_07600 [Propionivibrio sp.]|nr:hypothetical protein [Propionivibrio sp.]